ncbi:MAG TPA: uroporphyrinogen decarboxylase [candidate division Zixibacteria bacterium]|nr:uroporphyrinogen decarboxylase [candidate division Zixibacteria bacterium]
MIDTSATAGTWTGERRLRAALAHEQPDRTPVWFMRQAGRCLPDYRRLRERHDILTLAKTPDLCAEVTLMPVEAFGVDAAVLFADIMLPLEPMGVTLEIQPEIGPIIHDPIRSRRAVDALRLIEPAEELGFVMEAIRLVRRALDGRQAVIGFSGAPFTLACYLIEGRPSRDYGTAKAFMFREPEAWHALMERLSTVVIRYLNAQVEAGVHVVQLFDSWVGALTPADYRRYVQPHMARIFAEVRGARTIHFGTGAAHLLDAMAEAGGDLLGIDHRQPLDEAWSRIGFERGIQGNLDATRIPAGWGPTAEGARDVLRRAANRPGHVFNLGHGVTPDSDPGVLRRLVELVHEETER